MTLLLNVTGGESGSQGVGAGGGSGSSSLGLGMGGGGAAGGGGSSLGLGAGGGGGASSAGGNHNAGTPVLFQPSVSCPLSGSVTYLNEVPGANAADPTTWKCPEHGLFGLTTAALNQWHSNHPSSADQYEFDGATYQLACIPIEMRCPVGEASYSPEALGLNLSAPETWLCPLHPFGICPGADGAVHGEVVGGVMIFALCCVPSEEKPQLELGTDLQGKLGSLGKSPKKKPAKKKKTETFVAAGLLFAPAFTNGFVSPEPSAPIQAAASSSDSFISPASSEGDGGGWGDSGFSRSGGPVPSEGGGGIPSAGGESGLFSPSNGNQPVAPSADGSGPVDAVAPIALVVVVSAPSVSPASDAALPAPEAEEVVLVQGDAMEATVALAMLGLVAALVMMARSKQVEKAAVRRRSSLVEVAIGRTVAPVVLAQPKKRVDWSRYRHLVTDIVEDAVLAMRGWAQPKSNRLAAPVEAPAAAEESSTNRIAAIRVIKKELQETLS